MLRVQIILFAVVFSFLKLFGQGFKFRYESEFNPGISYSKLTGLGFNAGIRQRYFFTNKVALEAEGIYSLSWSNEYIGGSFQNSQRKFRDEISLGGTVYYHLNNDRKGLYIAGGLLKNSSHLDWVSRLGYKFPVNKHLFFTTEAVHFYNTGKVEEGKVRNGFLIKVGVGIRF